MGVATILEGGVQRTDNQIRINMQLINAVTDVHMWSETYTRTLTAENIFAIQSEIAKAVAIALKAVLTPKEEQGIERLPTQNLAALEAYFKAKASRATYSKTGAVESVEYLEKAVELDPNFTMAYAELASAYIGLIYWTGAVVEEQLSKAQPLIEKALRLDDQLSMTYVALGELNRHQGHFETARVAYQTAIRLNSNNVEAYGAYGRLQLWNLQNYPESVMLLTKQRELNPKGTFFDLNLPQALYLVGLFAEARAMIEGMLQENPGYIQSYAVLSEMEFWGEFKYAESCRSWRKSIPAGSSIAKHYLIMGDCYAHVGDRDLAIKWFDYMVKLLPESSQTKFAQAMIYELSGNYDSALDMYSEIGKSQGLMFDHMRVGLLANRPQEVLTFFKEHHPSFFRGPLDVTASNYDAAYSVGVILKAVGEKEQAKRILNSVLNAKPPRRYHKQDNWETRLYIALGDNDAALNAFRRHQEEGSHSIVSLTDPNFKPLFDEPEYKRIAKLVWARIDEERGKLRKMEARGEISIPPLPVHEKK